MSAPMFVMSAPMCRGCGRELSCVQASYADLLCVGCTGAVARSEMGAKYLANFDETRTKSDFNSPAWLVAVDAWLEAGGLNRMSAPGPAPLSVA